MICFIYASRAEARTGIGQAKLLVGIAEAYVVLSVVAAFVYATKNYRQIVNQLRSGSIRQQVGKTVRFLLFWPAYFNSYRSSRDFRRAILHAWAGTFAILAAVWIIASLRSFFH
jgi:hypothetical protein